MISRSLLPTAFTRHILALGAIATMTSTLPALATESGQNHYPIGVNTIMNGALPPPGQTSFYLYTQYYHSSRLNDSHGDSIDADFQSDVLAVVPRIVHAWNQTLGPFFLSSGVLLPMSRVEVKAFGKKDISTGLGDPIVQPLYFNYANSDGSFFAHFGPEFYIPAGEYDEDRLANNGLNYWTVATNFSATWMPSRRWELSATLYPEFNFRNKDTDYRSGNTVTFDFVVAHQLLESMPRLKVGVQGFAFKQLTDDKLNGETVGDGNRGQAFGLGPQVSYDIAGPGAAVLVKYQREFGVENRSQGNRFWFELALPF